MFEVFTNPDAWIALLSLTFLEIILGIDNIIFISIAAGKLEPSQRKKGNELRFGASNGNAYCIALWYITTYINEKTFLGI
ncbi:hypothetical protein LCGC14_0122700 [marine sediment metagenome]|uniref:Uncharacterized protein n=1 Tax=marine sediment metagenome TaxID=412755 RepID=A0A0F9Y8B4_9ZZZZ